MAEQKHGSWHRKLSAHIFKLQVQNRNRKAEIAWLLKLSKSSSSETLPAKRPDLLIPPPNSAITQGMKCWGLWRVFLIQTSTSKTSSWVIRTHSSLNVSFVCVSISVFSNISFHFYFWLCLCQSTSHFSHVPFSRTVFSALFLSSFFRHLFVPCGFWNKLTKFSQLKNHVRIKCTYWKNTKLLV